ncbi:MAG: hypothetical protein ACR2LN_06745 [Candidatus Levyibacteriota bacterium]
MSTSETTKKIDNLLSLLSNGSRNEIIAAKKAIEKLWREDSKQFTKCAPIALEYIAKVDQIKTLDNKIALVSGLRLFFLVLSDKYFDPLKSFTLKLLQHPHGHVREAIRKTAEWLFISLTSRAEPFIYSKRTQLSQKQKLAQYEARMQYVDLVEELELLIDKYETRTEDVAYIDEMKPSINKSLQMYWSRLTECRTYRKIIEQTQNTPYDILRKRKEIEEKITRMLTKENNDFYIDDVKEIIYFEESQNALTTILEMFSLKDKRESEVVNLIQLLNDAWNYFPHKVLNGLSPIEKISENSSLPKRKNSLPN